MRIVATMVQTKITKGAVRYDEVKDGEFVSGDDGTINSLYIRKAAIEGSDYPQKLTVTVEG